MTRDKSHKGKNLDVLSLEDSVKDFEFIKEQLIDAGYQLSMERVETEDVFTASLRNKAWDLILVDFKLPDFDAFHALRIRNEICPDTPFICISGFIGEETAIELLKSGAVDYVLKDRPHRLPFAVERAIGEASEKKIRQQKEAELHKVSMAVEQAGEMVMIADRYGAIQYVNPAFTAVSGYSREEVVGKNPRLLKSGMQDREFYQELWGTITKGRIWKGRLVNKRKDGTLYTEEATISPVKDATGRLLNYVAVKRDITEFLRTEEERAKLQEQLQHSQKMESIGILAGGVAHDFNNLLTTIIGNVQLVLGELEKKDPHVEDLKEIRKAGERATALTCQLLTFSRRETRSPELLDLNKGLEEMEKMLRRLIREDIDLKIMPCPDLWPVYMDPNQADQIIINLVVNARDAMPDGGTLTVETANTELDRAYFIKHGVDNKPGPYVMLAVTDTGIGMDEAVQKKMFEPFFTTKERGTGTGLGLSTVYGTVKQNGGYIWSYSEPGQGTAMTVYLPRAEEGIEPGQRDDVQAVGLTGEETVLIVEDNDSVRKMAVKSLSKYGYRVLEAVGGKKAMEICRQFKGAIHLLITDVVMPGMNGKELSERLRSERPDIKVLFMSGYTQDIILQKGILSPAIHYIQKPFSGQTLARKVRESIEGQGE